MTLRYAILEVGVDPAVLQALSLFLTISNERVVSKPAVVRMVMDYICAMLVG